MKIRVDDVKGVKIGDVLTIREGKTVPIMLNSEQTPEYSDIRRADHDGGEFSL